MTPPINNKRPLPDEGFDPNKRQKTKLGGAFTPVRTFQHSATGTSQLNVIQIIANTSSTPVIPIIPVALSPAQMQQKLTELEKQVEVLSQKNEEQEQLLNIFKANTQPLLSTTAQNLTSPAPAAPNTAKRLDLDSLYTVYRRKELYKKRDAQWIIEKCEKINETHPDFGIAQAMLGLVYTQKGELDKALPYLSRAVEKIRSLLQQNSNASVHNILMECLYAQGSSCYALGEFLQAKDPLDEITQELSNKVSNNSLTSQELELFNEARILRGLCEFKLGYYPLALETFRCVFLTRNTPIYSTVMLMTGICYQEIKEFITANECFKEVSKDYPEQYTEARYRMGECYLSCQKPLVAKYHFMEVFIGVPFNSPWSKHAKASITQADLMTYSETKPAFTYSEIKTHADKQEMDWIIQKCQKITKNNCTWFIFAKAHLGIALCTKNQFVEAEKNLREAITEINQINPPKDHFLFLETQPLLSLCNESLAICYLHSRQNDKATECFEKVEENQKNYIRTQANKILHYYYNLKKYDEVINALLPLEIISAELFRDYYTSDKCYPSYTKPFSFSVAALYIGVSYLKLKNYSKAKEFLKIIPPEDKYHQQLKVALEKEKIPPEVESQAKVPSEYKKNNT